MNIPPGPRYPGIMPLTLCPARPSDFLALSAWIPDAVACMRWAGPGMPFPFAPEALEDLLGARERPSYGLWEDGALVAFGQHWVLTPGRVHLGRILVAPEARGRGLGRVLCRRLMAEAVRATGAQVLTLRVYRDNTVAQALYASLGFQPVPAESTDEALFMETAMPATPKAVVAAWVEAFNRGDAAALTAMYHADAVNHQVAASPVEGREAIRAMFQREFAAAEMVCVVENLFEDGEWAILEWRDPLGLRGCGFFHVVEGRIAFQRGYWDKLSFLRQHGLPMPEA